MVPQEATSITIFSKLLWEFQEIMFTWQEFGLANVNSHAQLLTLRNKSYIVYHGITCFACVGYSLLKCFYIGLVRWRDFPGGTSSKELAWMQET